MLDENTQQLQEQNKQLLIEVRQLKQRCEQYEASYNQLLYDFKLFQRNRFGSKSEQFIDPGQRSLFDEGSKKNDLLQEEKNEKEEGDNLITIKSYKRRQKKSNLTFPPHLNRREEIIKVEEEYCHCGRKKVSVGYKSKELLHHIREVLECIDQKREIMVCPNRCPGSMKTAKQPLHVLPRAKVTEEFLSHLIISKCDDRQPHYHFEKQLESRHGIKLSRDNLSRWFIQASKALQPLWNLLKDEILDYDIASIDPTSLQVLNEENRKPTQKGYWYCIRGGPPNKAVVLYDYNATQHKLFLRDWFENFRGYLQVDGENIFDVFIADPKVTLAYCNVHCRRNFEPIAKAAKGDGVARKILQFYQLIYQNEKEIKKRGLNSRERYDYRLEHSQPIFNRMKTYAEETYHNLLPESPLGKGFHYLMNRWDGLTCFLKDGRLEADTNGTEREVKPAVMARKMFLFAASLEGAKALCIHMTLIRSAIYHGHDPYHYYVEILKRIPYCQSIEEYEALLPWAISSERPYQKTA